MNTKMNIIVMGVASCICMLLLVTPAYSANVIISGDYTDVGTIVVVSPKPGDTAATNGTALLNTLAGITTASATEPYLIRLGPGIYDLGSNSLQMKQYVSIEGSGEEATTITAAISSSVFPANTATVQGANYAGLRFVTVNNSGAGSYTAAILNTSASPSLIHVTATASGGSASCGVYNNSSSPTMTNVTATASGGTTSNNGVSNYFSSSPTMTNVTATASGGTYSYGVYNYSSSSPTMTNVTATASGGTALNYGVYNYSSSSPTMTNVTVTASGGTTSYGVYNNNTSPTMTNVTATASGGTYSYGVYNNYSSPTMTNVTAKGSGGTSNYGLYNYAASGSYTVIADRCTFEGSPNSIYNTAPFTVKVGASKLIGAANAVGTYNCTGAYNGSTYAALSGACQ